MTLTFSNSHLWVPCEAAVSSHPGTAPDGDAERTDQQLEGEAAAWLAQKVFGAQMGVTVDEFVGEQAPNGWPIDATMARHVAEYLKLLGRGDAEAFVVEESLRLFGGLVSGRPDGHTANGAGRILRIIELKYGYKLVEPQGNTQLILPAIGLADPRKHDLISLEVFQPRAHHVAGKHRKWILNHDELKQWAEYLSIRASATLMESPTQRPGEQCDWCPRRGTCPALTATVYAHHDIIRSRQNAVPMSAADLGREAVFIEMAEALIKARKSGIMAELEARMKGKNKEFVADYMWDNTRKSNRTWTASPAMVAITIGMDPRETTMISPAAAEAAGADPEKVAMVSASEPLPPKLVRYNPKKMAKIFK